VVLGYACTLLLNSTGDFRLQKNYYTAAAAVMGIAVFPAVKLAGIVAVAAVYLVVRTVDVWLLLAAVKRAGRQIKRAHVLVLVLVWLLTGYAAWAAEPLLIVAGAVLFGSFLLRTTLSYPALHQPSGRSGAT
jgi:hypothetical protein